MSENAADIFTDMLRLQSEAAQAAIAATIPDEMAIAEWSEAAERLQRQWLEFQASSLGAAEAKVPLFADPAQWLEVVQAWQRQMPWFDPERQARLAAESAELWDTVLTQYGLGTQPDPDGPEVTCPAPTAASPTRPGASSRSTR